MTITTTTVVKTRIKIHATTATETREDDVGSCVLSRCRYDAGSALGLEQKSRPDAGFGSVVDEFYRNSRSCNLLRTHEENYIINTTTTV